MRTIGLHAGLHPRHTLRTGGGLLVGSAVSACALSLAGVLLWSRGKPRPVVDEHGSPIAGSVAEKLHVAINGVEQGMFIKSIDTANPLLLFLHGGPGMPEYFLTRRYP